MPALRCFAVLHLFPLLAVLSLLQQAHLLPVAAEQATMAPPDYITSSSSGAFSFVFGTLDSVPAKFFLATWFRSGHGVSSELQSVVLFAKESPGSGTTLVATAQSILSVMADNQLDGGNQMLWKALTATKRAPDLDTVHLSLLLVITIGFHMVQHYLGRNKQGQWLLSSSVRAFSLSSFQLNARYAPFLIILLQQAAAAAAAAAPTNQLTSGSSMTTTQYLISPSSIFAFGFCDIDPNLGPNQVLLAIWFDFGASNCTNKAVVWFTRDPTSNHTVIASKQSILTLDNGNLSLIDDKSILWSPSTLFGSNLLLQDSGNLQLLDGAGRLQWQSFDHPTHALLPGQNMTNNPAETYLQSKITDNDFSLGRFTLNLQSDGNIVLYMWDPDLPIDTRNYTAQGYGVVGAGYTSAIFFNESGALYCSITDSNGTVVKQGDLMTPLQPSDADGHYKYTSLDPDGTIRLYMHPKNKTDGISWDAVEFFPIGVSDGCDRNTNNGLQGMCGPNSYCKVSSLKEQRLECECPDGYVFEDEQHKYRGCRPNFVPHACDGKDHSGEFTTVQMQTIVWSDQSAYKKYPPPTTIEQCNTSCLNNCFCVASLVDGSGCTEVLALTDGKQTSNAKMIAMVKVGATSPSVPGSAAEPGPASLRSILLFIILGILAISLVASITYILLQHYASKKAQRSLSAGLITFTHKELYRATNGFRELLGKGGFGEVCKGELSYLHPPYVAVKKLIKSNDRDESDFENEVQSIGRIHHKNLVRMIGYCKEGVHRMLVFEYMQGGTLADFIFRSERPYWSCLAEAAIGIAKGLEYLHEGCKCQIIHRDIKPENILFDDKNTPKITDFGIARLLGDQKTHHTVTTIAGTRPYVAPEWFDGGGQVSSKVDVYSFGVMLLEMICWKRVAGEQGPNDQGHGTVSALRTWAERLIRSGRAELLVQGESEPLADMESVERFTRVAIWCLQKEPSTRPSMHNVVQMLEGTAEVEPLPDPPRPPSFSEILPTGSGTLHYGS